MIKGYIYVIKTPSGKNYVGQTSNIECRKRAYNKINAIKKQKYLYNDCIKYGYIPSNYLEIIEEIDYDPNIVNAENDNLLDLCEIKWIKDMNTYAYYDSNGLNLTKGGKSRKGYITSEETKEKLRQANIGKHTSKGHVKSAETCKKLSESNTGKKLSEETKKKISDSLKCKIVSEETKKKLSESNSGKIRTKEHQEKIINSLKNSVKSMRIEVFNYKTNEFTGISGTCSECAAILKISTNSIYRVLDGTRKQTHGYFFKVKNKENN